MIGQFVIGRTNRFCLLTAFQRQIYDLFVRCCAIAGLFAAAMTCLSPVVLAQPIQMELEGDYTSSGLPNVKMPFFDLDKIIVTKDALLLSPTYAGVDQGIVLERKVGATSSFSGTTKSEFTGGATSFRYVATVSEINADASIVSVSLRTDTVSLALNKQVNVRTITQTTYRFRRNGRGCTGSISDDAPVTVQCEAIPNSGYRCVNTAPKQQSRVFNVKSCSVGKAY